MIMMFLIQSLLAGSVDELKCAGPALFGTALAREDRTPRVYDPAGQPIGARTWSDLKIAAGEPVPVYAITTRELIVIADRAGAQGACLYVNRGAFEFACSCSSQVQGANPIPKSSDVKPSGARQSGLQICPIENRVNCPR
jgi:hypothetical protein